MAEGSRHGAPPGRGGDRPGGDWMYGGTLLFTHPSLIHYKYQSWDFLPCCRSCRLLTLHISIPAALVRVLYRFSGDEVKLRHVRCTQIR
jgi:hypothetical protein